MNALLAKGLRTFTRVSLASQLPPIRTGVASCVQTGPPSRAAAVQGACVRKDSRMPRALQLISFLSPPLRTGSSSATDTHRPASGGLCLLERQQLAPGWSRCRRISAPSSGTPLASCPLPPPGSQVGGCQLPPDFPGEPLLGGAPGMSLMPPLQTQGGQCGDPGPRRTPSPHLTPRLRTQSRRTSQPPSEKNT